MNEGPASAEGATQDELARRVCDALHARNRAARALGIVVRDVRRGYAEVALTVRDEMLNAQDLCHGGVLFTLADVAFNYASASLNEASVALQCSITFAVPARAGEELLAIAVQRVQGGRTGTYDVTVSSSDGSLLALFRGTNYRFKTPIV